MDKMVKVSKETHLALKVGASNRGISMKEHLAKLSNDNIEGIIFDVNSHSTDWLESVRDDIVEELERRKENDKF